MDGVVEMVGNFAHEIFSSSALWGFAGVMAGGWLTWRREISLRRHERDRDMQFAAVSLSASLVRFISACADVAGDDGTCMGQVGPDGVLHAQTKLPLLDYSSLKVEWRSLPVISVDKLFQFQNHVTDEHARLEFEYDSDFPPYDGYFIERRVAFTDLGIEAASLIQELRAAVHLEPSPESVTLKFLRERKCFFEKLRARRASADKVHPLAGSDE